MPAAVVLHKATTKKSEVHCLLEMCTAKVALLKKINRKLKAARIVSVCTTLLRVLSSAVNV